MEQVHFIKAINIIANDVAKCRIGSTDEGGWISIQQCDHELLDKLRAEGFRYSLYDGEITLYDPKEE